MPERLHQPTYANSIVGKLGGYDYLEDREFRDVLQSHENPVIGFGLQFSVESISDTKVVAYDKNWDYFRFPTYAKTHYLYQKILHTLYPDHFPRFHAAVDGFFDKTGKPIIGHTVRERVYFDEQATREFMQPRQRGLPSELSTIMNELNLNGIPLWLDPNPANIVVDRNGRRLFLDIAEHIYNVPSSVAMKDWDIAQLRSFLQTRKYPQAVIVEVVRAAQKAQRYEELGETASALGDILYTKGDSDIDEILENTESTNQLLTKQWGSRFLKPLPISKYEQFYVWQAINFQRYQQQLINKLDQEYIASDSP